MAPTRRAFLTGISAAPATLTTGGAAPSVIAGKLLAEGRPYSWLFDNFPQKLQNLCHYSFDFIIDGHQASTLREIISGNFSWNDATLKAFADKNFGRVHAEITKFPPNASPLLYLSEDSLSLVYGADDSDLDEIPDVIAARKLRELLHPICDENTTFGQLQDSFLGSFERLAKEVIGNPIDFSQYAEGTWTEYNSDLRSSIYDFLIDNGGNKDTETMALLSEAAQSLGKIPEGIRPQVIKKQDAELAAEWKEIRKKDRQIEAAKTAEREKAIAERRRDPSKRKPLKVCISHSTEEGEYVVERARTRKILLHEDWIRYAQEIDPDMQAEDIVIEHGGAILQTHSSKLCAAFDSAIAKSPKKGEGLIYLPNQRDGVDLNELAGYR